MKRIDTTNWKEFRVGDLFETQNIGKQKQVPTGASIPKLDLIENGSIPRVSVSGINNGIIGYFDYKRKSTKDYRIYNNFISVSFLGTIFYHHGDATLDMKVHCLKPLNVVLNKYTGHFLVSALKSSLRSSSYADQISSTVLPNLFVNLPVDVNNQPDWHYMEQYMIKVEEKVKSDMLLIHNIIGGG